MSGPSGNTKKESIASASVWGAGQQLLAQFVLSRGLGLCPTGGLTVRRVDARALVPAEARGSSSRDMYFPCCVWAQGRYKVCSWGGVSSVSFYVTTISDDIWMTEPRDQS